MISVKNLVEIEKFLNKDGFSNIKLEYISPIYKKKNKEINLFSKFDANRAKVEDIIFEDAKGSSTYLIPVTKRNFQKFTINIFHCNSWKKLLIKSKILDYDENGDQTISLKIDNYNYFNFNDKMRQGIDQRIIDYVFHYIVNNKTNIYSNPATIKIDKSSYLYSEIKKRMILM